MKTINRYISTEIIIATFIAIAIFVFVLLSGKIIRDGLELALIAKASFGLFIKLILVLILYVFIYALPLGLLTGILLVFGRMSAQKEIIALYAAGFSLSRIAKPVFVIASVGALLSCTINFYIAPKSKSFYKDNLGVFLLKNPTDLIREKTFVKELPGFIIYVDALTKDQLENVWIWQLDAHSNIETLLKAERATIKPNPAHSSLIFDLEKGSAERAFNAAENVLPLFFFDHLSIEMKTNVGTKAKDTKTDYNLMTWTELMDEIKKHPEMKQSIWNLIHKKLALGLSIFVLAIIGIPLGIKTHRTETHANLGLALVLSIAYYGLSIAMNWFENSWVPYSVLIWIPNILFSLFGIYLFNKVKRGI